ncbi:B12-binding domain-containing protein [Methanococcoides sp. NM1]|uniref:B12-binding domain-containing protein n=1 Tax=Methanococcoides sp. NM1 TaxID=1201013 RepID=UPI001083DD84
MKRFIVNNDETAAKEAIEEEITAGIAPVEIIESGLSAGMLEVGSRFEDGEIFLPQVMMSFI